MALIANLAVALTAHTSQFSSKLKSAAKDIKSFAGEIATAFAPVAGVAALAAGLGFVAQQANQAIEANLNLAKKLDATYNQMMELRVAADLAGGSVEAMSGAMEELQIRLGKGDTGAMGALSKLGLDPKALIGKGIHQQITLISDSISKLGSSEARAAIASELFGKKSKELINMFMEGKPVFAEAEKYIQRTGLAMSDSAAEGAKIFNDTLKETVDSTKGLAQQTTILVNGPLTLMLDSLNKILQALVSIPKAMNRVAESFLKNGDNFKYISGATLSGMDKARMDAIAELRKKTLIDQVKGESAFHSTNHFSDLDRIEKDIADGLAAGQKSASDSGFRILKFGLITFATVLESHARKFVEQMGPTLEAQKKINAAYQKAFENQHAASMDPRTEFTAGGGISGRVNSPIAAAASAGTRGTFASETAGRSVASFNLEKQQLDALNDIRDSLTSIDESTKGGIALS